MSQAPRICVNCMARCEEPKDLPRFLRRHPSKCSARIKAEAAKKTFSKQLARDVRSVDADGWLEDKD